MESSERKESAPVLPQTLTFNTTKMNITVNELIILMALARFKFLTSAQLKKILGCKSLSTVNSALRSLK